MSSLSATQADGYYRPPDEDPTQKRSRPPTNQYEKHGILRFELPLDGWCLSCSTFISKGTRFNAKKNYIGKYFSTSLYSFSFSCPSCASQIEIETDPENRSYKYAKGIRKHEADLNYIASYDHKSSSTSLSASYDLLRQEDGVILIDDEEEKEKKRRDPMYKLQVNEIKRKRLQEMHEDIQFLMEDSRQDSKKNDFLANLRLRKVNRQLRKNEERLTEEGERVGLPIALLENSQDDDIQAGEFFKKAKLESMKKDLYNNGISIAKKSQIASSIKPTSTSYFSSSLLEKRSHSSSLALASRSSYNQVSDSFLAPPIKLIKRIKKN